MQPDGSAGRSGGHVTDEIDLYLTGGLTPDREDAFEEHLLGCAACLVEVDEASSVAVAVAGLSPTVVREMERESQAAETPPPVPTPDRRERPRFEPRPRPGARPDPGARSGPETRSGPEGRPRPGTRSRRAAQYAAALVIGVLAGIGGVALVHHNSSGDVPVAQRIGPAGPVQFTLTATAGAGGTEVRAVVVGLHPGEAFDLVAIGSDGHNYLVDHDIAAGGPQIIVGTAAIAPDGILFYVVLQGQEILMVNRAD